MAYSVISSLRTSKATDPSKFVNDLDAAGKWASSHVRLYIIDLLACDEIFFQSEAGIRELVPIFGKLASNSADHSSFSTLEGRIQSVSDEGKVGKIIQQIIKVRTNFL